MLAAAVEFTFLALLSLVLSSFLFGQLCNLVDFLGPSMWPGCGKPPFTLPSSYPLSTPIFPSGCNPNRKEEPPLARNSIIEADRKERVGWKKEEQCWCEVEDSKTKPAKRRKEGAEKLTEATACHAKARRQAKMEEEDIDKTKLRLKPERNSKRNPKGLKLRGGWDARSLFGATGTAVVMVIDGVNSNGRLQALVVKD